MYFCRFQYKRRSLQRPASLTQLLAYLLNPKQVRHGVRVSFSVPLLLEMLPKFR